MRLIDADEIMKLAEPYPHVSAVFRQLLRNIKTIDAVPVRHGEWIPVTNGRGDFECDNCHNYAPSYRDGVEWLSDFCPNCGANMRGKENG